MSFFCEQVGNEVYLIGTFSGQNASAQHSGLNMLKLLRKVNEGYLQSVIDGRICENLCLDEAVDCQQLATKMFSYSFALLIEFSDVRLRVV